jgi:aspartyl-tRNA(Asn)/glutamyl-tRNA(Gln) amidotransferase subunit A
VADGSDCSYHSSDAGQNLPVTLGAPDWTLHQPAAALAKRTISSEELTKLCLERIHKYGKGLKAFITLTEESALLEARECDRQRAAGQKCGRLHGIPNALKDNFDTAGVLTTAGSQVFRDRVPAKDAEVNASLEGRALCVWRN